MRIKDIISSEFAQLIGPGDVDIPRSSIDIASVMSFIFTLAGAIAVIIIAIAGFQYIVSSGDAASTAKAKNAIIYAVIGLIVCIAAFSIVNFVGSRI